MKANASLALLRALAEAGCGFDVNSRGELYRTLKAGAAPGTITMTGVGKSTDDIRDGLAAGIAAFNAESFEECARISGIAGEAGETARVVLRINPDIPVHTHPYIATGLAEHKFGLSEQDARDVLPRILALPHIEVHGFGMHLGSQLFDASPWAAGLTKLLHFVASVSACLPGGIQVLNIGGGLGVPYAENETDISPAVLVAAIEPILREGGLSHLRIFSEPGRWFVANAGVLITKVEYIKRSNSRTFIILDAGMNDLIRPALYEAHHEIRPLLLHADRPVIRAEIVGPVCESGDLFAKDRLIQEVREGEYVAIFSAGAYGSTMSSNYNSRPFACEAGVRDGEWKIIRRRQNFEEMTASESEKVES